MKLKSIFLNWLVIVILLLITVILYSGLENLNIIIVIERNFELLCFTSVIFTLFNVAVLVVREYKQKKELNMLSNKLTDLTQKGKYTHIILNPENPYYKLSKSINEVQSMQRDFSKDYQRQQRGYFSLLEYLTIGVMVIDQDNLVYLANHAFSEIFDKEMDQKKIAYYYVLDNFELIQLIEQAFRTKKDQHKEVKHRADSEKYLDVQVLYVPLSKHHFLFMCLVSDITERKKIEQMQMDFVSNVSHELKTPITSISGFSETLLQGAIDDSTVNRQFIEIIYRESKELSELVNDMLSISRIESNKNLKLEKIELQPFFKESLESFTSLITKNNLTIDVQLNENRVILCDKSKLRHIINNLVQNAVRYNKENGTITIEVKVTQNEWQMIISDTGIGIDLADQQRIYERFYRADQARTKKVPGTGLGLAVVKEYINSLSGRIKVQSTLGVGTSFTVTLPIFNDL